MSNLNLKGVWIPIEILTDNKLSDKEKYIYAIILLRQQQGSGVPTSNLRLLQWVRFLYLSKENNYCYLTNKSISELLNISITQVSKLVNSLKDKNYISIELIYKENSKQIEMRKLIPIVKNNDTYKKVLQCITKQFQKAKKQENISVLLATRKEVIYELCNNKKHKI